MLAPTSWRVSAPSYGEFWIRPCSYCNYRKEYSIMWEKKLDFSSIRFPIIWVDCSNLETITLGYCRV